MIIICKFVGEEEARDRDKLRSEASGVSGHLQRVQQTVSGHYDNDNNDHNDHDNEGTWVRLSRL